MISQAQTSHARVWTPRPLQPCLGFRTNLLQHLQQDALRRAPGCCGMLGMTLSPAAARQALPAGERERPRPSGGGAGCCRSHEQHPSCALRPLWQRGSGQRRPGESSLLRPRTCRTSLTTYSQGKTRTSWGSPPPQDLNFSPKGSAPSFKTPTFQ